MKFKHNRKYFTIRTSALSGGAGCTATCNTCGAIHKSSHKAKVIEWAKSHAGIKCDQIQPELAAPAAPAAQPAQPVAPVTPEPTKDTSEQQTSESIGRSQQDAKPKKKSHKKLPESRREQG